MSGEERSQDWKDGYEAGLIDGYDDGASEPCNCGSMESELPPEDEIARYLVAEKLCPNLTVAETVAQDMVRRLFE